MSVLRVEGSQELDVALVDYALEVGEQVAPGGCQVERVGASVDGVAASLGEPALLEIVDERDHGAAVDAQRVAERLLGPALGGGEVAQHSEVPGVELESGEAFGEQPMRVGAQLGQAGSRGAGLIPAPRTPARWVILRAPGDSTAARELFLI